MTLLVTMQVANSLALGTSPIVRALFDPEGGMRDVRALDAVSFSDWFKSHGGSQASIDRMWCVPVVLAVCEALRLSHVHRCTGVRRLQAVVAAVGLSKNHACTCTG